MKEKLQFALSDFKAAIKLILQNTKKRKSDPIRVGFIGRYIPAWNKVEGLYREMLKDDRFEPMVICLPAGISDFCLENPDSLENDTYDYYKSNGYKRVTQIPQKIAEPYKSHKVLIWYVYN